MASLADLQTEREKLRAAQAKQDFESAHAATCSQAELLAAALAVRKVIFDTIDAAGARLLEAIHGERDETRVHYLMSDCVHDLLAGIGDRSAQASTALPLVGERVKRGIKPRELLTVSQWADKYRELKSGTNAPGRWHTALTPYLAEIMDCLSEHSAVRQVTFIKSSGVGGTEAMNNWIGYIMHHLQNKDLLVVVPTLELRDRSFNPRLSKMIDESAVLADLVSTASRSKANRGDLLEYGARARVIKAGANSPDSLRSDHLPYVICDEVDAFPWDVGGEGDPMTLIENRQRTYSRAKTYLISTPTVSPSRIDSQYKRSDRRRYHVPCPHCGELQHLEFGGKEKLHGIKWRIAPKVEGDDGLDQVVSAWYVCKECGAEIDEGHKAEMLAKGRWIAERPNIKHHRGYHINALYAPTGLGLNWRKVAQKWLDSQGDTAEMKGFINTYLGEVWEEKGDSIEGLSLISRLEDYAVSLPVALITAGVDVQKNRLEASIVGWGVGEEAWLLDHIIIDGDTARPEVWDELDAVLVDAGVQYAAIDSGYNTSMVYGFCEKRRWTVPIKGVTGLHRPLIEDERRRKQRLRTKRKKGQPVEPLGVDQGKALVYARVKLIQPGPGYIHFKNDSAFDDEYFAQLAAEKLVTKIKGTRPFQEWVQIRPRNEALDCFDEETDVLTLDGWKKFKDIAETDLLATVALEKDEIEYQRPIALIDRQYDGEMVQIKGSRIDILVTPNHRMVTLKKRNEKDSTGRRRWNFDVPAEITLAKDLTIHHAIKINSTWVGEALNMTSIPCSFSDQGREIEPAREVAAHDMAAFLGWWVSEGSASKAGYSRRVIISQTKAANLAEIETILNRLPWRWNRESGGKYSITSKQLYDYVCQFGRLQEDRIAPEWVKRSDPTVIACFVNTMIAGDGWSQQKKESHRVSRAFATTSVRLADDMQELFIKLGNAATLRVVDGADYLIRGRSGTVKRQYHVYERLASRAHLDGGGNGKREFIGKRVNYSGRVYCASVPNGTLIVRRGGKTFIAGNCLVYALAACRLSGIDLARRIETLAASKATAMDVLIPVATQPRRAGGFVKGWK